MGRWTGWSRGGNGRVRQRVIPRGAWPAGGTSRTARQFVVLRNSHSALVTHLVSWRAEQQADPHAACQESQGCDYAHGHELRTPLARSPQARGCGRRGPTARSGDRRRRFAVELPDAWEPRQSAPGVVSECRPPAPVRVASQPCPAAKPGCLEPAFPTGIVVAAHCLARGPAFRRPGDSTNCSRPLAGPWALWTYHAVSYRVRGGNMPGL